MVTNSIAGAPSMPRVNSPSQPADLKSQINIRLASRDLSPTARAVLESEPIQQLIIQGHMNIDLAMTINYPQMFVLTDTTINGMITNGRLSASEVIHLNEQQIQNLKTPTVVTAINEGRLNFYVAKNLTADLVSSLENPFTRNDTLDQLDDPNALGGYFQN